MEAPAGHAQVVSLPGQVHILLAGWLLELLEEELVVVLGREMAHHLLWSLAGGDQWVLDRLVQASAADVAASRSHTSCWTWQPSIPRWTRRRWRPQCC